MARELNDNQIAFVREMIADEVSPTEAARRCGLADPGHAGERMMSNSTITGLIMKGKNRKLLGWSDLEGYARSNLRKLSADTRKVRMKQVCTKCGEETEHIADEPVPMRLNLEAAKLIYAVLCKASPETIAARAQTEDVANLQGAVDRILGTPAPMVQIPETVDAHVDLVAEEGDKVN